MDFLQLSSYSPPPFFSYSSPRFFPPVVPSSRPPRFIFRTEQLVSFLSRSNCQYFPQLSSQLLSHFLSKIRLEILFFEHPYYLPRPL